MAKVVGKDTLMVIFFGFLWTMRQKNESKGRIIPDGQHES
jgi:hypothetical protein